MGGIGEVYRGIKYLLFRMRVSVLRHTSDLSSSEVKQSTTKVYVLDKGKQALESNQGSGLCRRDYSCLYKVRQ